MAEHSPSVTAGNRRCLRQAVGWTAPCMLQGRSFNPEVVISMPIVNRVAGLEPDIQAWRRDIHEHPDCSTRSTGPRRWWPIAYASSASTR